MGIIAADVVIESTGVQLAAAYIGLSRNTLLINPAGGAAFTVQTAYDIWNSHADRLAGRAPVANRLLQYRYTSEVSPASLYVATYDQVKALFPGYTDEQAAAAPPAQDPAAPPAEDPAAPPAEDPVPEPEPVVT